MKKYGEVLIVDDNEDLLKAAKALLKRHFRQVDTLRQPAGIPAMMVDTAYDLILLDMNFAREMDSGEEGFQWLDRILELSPAAIVVLITAYGDVAQAVKAMKAGATDFVLKPWDNDKFIHTLKTAMERRHTRLEADQLKSAALLEAHSFQQMIGSSEVMRRVFDTISQVAETDASVLILGENGTGKELVARALHQKSLRAKKPFVSVDLGAITETLFESELFGHVKGAFTDAREDKAGRFELAAGGTFFLDEIGNLTLSLQAKLLSILQNRTVTRVGSNKARPVDIRLVCATNQPIREMIARKDFREDLYYRINTIEIQLPALRDRVQDIPLLAAFFLHQYSEKYKKDVRGIHPTAMARLERYNWPGNVRELQHAIERAVIMSKGDRLRTEDFFFKAQAQQQEKKPIDAGMLEDLQLEEIERIMIKKALKKNQGNITKAASELGLTRASLYRRLEKYGL